MLTPGRLPLLALLGAAGVVWSVSLTAGIMHAPPSDQPSADAGLAPGRTPTLSTPDPGAGPFDQPIVGFSISLHHTDQFHRYLRAVDEIADAGFNTLQVVTPMFQQDGASTTIQRETGPGRGPTETQLRDLLQHARRRGLNTSLLPIVLFTQPRGSEWRGKISPEHWEPWWRSYRARILEYADLAAEADVDILSVGSELLSTERQVSRWRPLIAEIRTRFGGRLTYSTNWDHFHVPALWRELDLIGISGYWDLTTLSADGKPTDEQLARRWSDIRTRVLAFGEAQGKPVLITEVGYPALPWALKDPWNYVANDQTRQDLHAQARGYQSFLTAWNDLLAPTPGPAPDPARPLAGVVFYEWSPYYQGQPDDTGYGVKGKPAQRLLTDWLRRRASGF